ncbi:MAG: HPr(Ser) kinase/phosphatase [Gammaproteobacteria bacterium]|nr:HPr(Ser) kinase/phosphatase [Gammaproteobacteria bacterium]
MTAPVTVRSLYDTLRTRLGLKWSAGRAGQERRLPGAARGQSGVALVGYLNLIHRTPVQVLGTAELGHLRTPGKNAGKQALERLFSAPTTLVIVAGGASVPRSLKIHADASGTPLLASRLPGAELIAQFQYHLATVLAEKITLHGVFMEIMGIGVLLAGGSGVGKSELALELVSRGHRLIADDAPEFARLAPDILSGTCPELLWGFLEVRGLGVLNIRAMFGDGAIKQSKHLRLIIKLERLSKHQLRALDRLRGSRGSRRLLGVEVPEITLPVAPGRNLAVLVEAAVRNHVLNLKGYDAGRDLSDRQQSYILRGHS